MKESLMKNKLILICICCFLATGCENNSNNPENTEEKTEGSYIDKIDTPNLPNSIKLHLKDVSAEKINPDEQKLFDDAYNLWINDNPEKSIDAFKNLIKDYPESSLADDAQYYIGMNYNNLEQPQEAINAFAKVILEYPNSSSIAPSYYSIAYTYNHQLKSPEKAYPYYVECLNNANEMDFDIIQKSIDELSSNTDISIDASELSYNAISNLHKDLEGFSSNSNEGLEEIMRIANEHSKTLLRSDQEIAYNYIKDNYPNYYDSNEKMELTMYYGAILDYANPDSFDIAKLGFKALECVKYVYRGVDSENSQDTQNHLLRLKELIDSCAKTF